MNAMCSYFCTDKTNAAVIVAIYLRVGASNLVVS
jgi:hypothetical protein